jgi:hypothetical protein
MTPPAHPAQEDYPSVLADTPRDALPGVECLAKTLSVFREPPHQVGLLGQTALCGNHLFLLGDEVVELLRQHLQLAFQRFDPDDTCSQDGRG